MLGDKVTRFKFLEFLGRDPHYSAAGRDYYHIKQPSWPEYYFEWHPKKRNVYVARTGNVPMVGEIIAFNVETHGDAHNAVLIWLRGVQEGRHPGVKHHLLG